MTAAFRWRRPDEADHARIAPVLDAWWGGRDMSGMLPRLFFKHFAGTSLVAETDDGALAGFVVAFVSQDDPTAGYIHFVGVDPAQRATGLGRDLYERTFADLRGLGCTRVRAITSPVNTGSIAFHTRMGFERVGPPVHVDYDGPGEDRVVFSRTL